MSASKFCFTCRNLFIEILVLYIFHLEHCHLVNLIFFIKPVSINVKKGKWHSGHYHIKHGKISWDTYLNGFDRRLLPFLLVRKIHPSRIRRAINKIPPEIHRMTITVSTCISLWTTISVPLIGNIVVVRPATFNDSIS